MYLYINIYCLYGYYKTIVHEVHFNRRCRYIHLRARKNEIENENAVNLGELFYFTTLAVWIYIFFNSITFFCFLSFPPSLFFLPTASEMWEKLEAAAKNNNTEFEILLFWCSHLVFVNTTEKRHSSLLFCVILYLFPFNL